jgi:tetratricopeptide (TPR) repeat protein
MRLSASSPIPYALAVAALLLVAYSNHFRNGFHFDDSHSIQDNIYVRELKHIPRYFRDATTFSVLPLNQSYRPVLQTTFAIDYWLGGGYNPLAFQIDTFIWFVLLLVAMASLYLSITRDAWVTLVAISVYALHPVCAETVNYIVQRGDLLSTLGVVGALVIYVRWPAQRRTGLYLIPFVLAALVKPPALVFPALLAAYLALFDRRARIAPSIAPAVVLTIVLAWWLSHMNPPTATTGASDGARYLWTQPYVAARYFLMFFAPTGLSADNDWSLVTGPSDSRTLIGLAFVAALAWTTWRLSRADTTRPVAFGLIWFIITLLPTSLTPLAEVANDHRMFFPFVGLSLAVTVAAALVLARVVSSRSRFAIGAVSIAVILLAESAAVYARNEVWRTDEALWRDVVEKSPRNGRGWMNYGLTLMSRADYQGATDAFNTALPLTPNYHLLEINMGLAYGGLKQPAEAERHFLRAISIEPLDWRSHRYYAGWLGGAARPADALAHARIARELNPADLDVIPIEQRVASVDGTPDYHLARSLAEYQMGRYRESIASARRALALRPSYAEAWNNVAAGHIALREWDQGIAACEEALRLNPSLQIARNNLNFARQQMQTRK